VGVIAGCNGRRRCLCESGDDRRAVGVSRTIMNIEDGNFHFYGY
jgi:hypothetical protein